jgi:nucleoside-diphosphate-sugar epimerase
VRSTEKGDRLKAHFDRVYGTGGFSFHVLPNMVLSHDDAVQGATGVVHLASPVLAEADPNVAIPSVVRGTISVLEAAAKESFVKRVCLCSSSAAATVPEHNRVVGVDENSWNEVSVEAAWAPSPHEGSHRTLHVYCTSKVEGEQAAWKFVREQKPNFAFNTVLPNACIGKILSPKHQGFPSTASWIFRTCPETLNGTGSGS